MLAALYTVLWAAVGLLTALVVTVTLVLAFLMNAPNVRRMQRFAEAFPQPPKIPIFAHLPLVFTPKEELFWLPRKLCAEYGHRYVVTLLAKPAFALSEPKAIEAVLSSSKHIEKDNLYRFLHSWLGMGLLTSSGELWHSRRKLLTPAFHFRILDKFSDQLQHHAQGLVDEILEARAQLPKGEPLDVAPLVSRCTLMAICETAMGTTDFNNMVSGGAKNYLSAIHSMGRLLVHRIMRPWLWYPYLYNLSPSSRAERKCLSVLHGFTEKVIAERKAQLEQAGWDEGAGDQSSLRRPFLDVLLRAQHEGAALSDLDIRNEVDTFMFEGHDTTSMGIVWALELLGQHPSVQERLAEEVLGADLTWDSVSKLSYLDMVVKECLRLRPSVPFIGRMVTGDIDIGDGMVLPNGALIRIHVYDLHRHKEYFPDPEKFDPERFTPEMERTRHPFAYLPFSAGPRNCIGKRYAMMEVKLFVSAVIRNFVIRAERTSSVPNVTADLVLRPKNGIQLFLTPR